MELRKLDWGIRYDENNTAYWRAIPNWGPVRFYMVVPLKSGLEGWEWRAIYGMEGTFTSIPMATDQMAKDAAQADFANKQKDAIARDHLVRWLSAEMFQTPEAAEAAKAALIGHYAESMGAVKTTMQNLFSRIEGNNAEGT